MIQFLQEIIDKLSEIDSLIEEESNYKVENLINEVIEKCKREQAMWEIAEESEKLGIDYK